MFSHGMRWCVVFSLLASVSVHEGQCLQERSDDVLLQSLSTLVQQQAATIQQLQASMTAMQNRMTSLETADQHQSAHLQQLDTKLNMRVSFSAYMGKTSINVGTSNSPFIFDAVVTNIGNAYNPQTGVFISPANGLYIFFSQVMNDATHAWMTWGIFKSSTMLCSGHLDPSGSFDSSSCEASVYLNKGDTVVVRRLAGDTTDQVIYGGIYVSFTGFLLNPDSA